MTRVLVAGALHYDVIVSAPRMPALDETLHGSAVSYAFGGKGGNQAVAAARHGAQTAFAGQVGDDEAGRFLLAALDAAGVDRGQVRIDPAHASGMSAAIVDDSGDYAAVIVSGANAFIDPDTVTIADGTKILLLQNEIPEPVNLAVARKAKAAGIRVILNAAPVRALAPELAELIDIAMVNRVEAGAMAGQAFPLIVETRGGEGAVARFGDGSTITVPAPRVDVVSTHGAGDCFAGAFAARLALGDGEEAALRYAVAAAALHVSVEPSMRATITPANVSQMMNRL